MGSDSKEEEDETEKVVDEFLVELREIFERGALEINDAIAKRMPIPTAKATKRGNNNTAV